MWEALYDKVSYGHLLWTFWLLWKHDVLLPRVFYSINEKETSQFTNNQIVTVINGRQGEKICSSETKRVWMWATLSDKLNDEKCFIFLNWYNNMFLCHQGYFESRKRKHPNWYTTKFEAYKSVYKMKCNQKLNIWMDFWL